MKMGLEMQIFCEEHYNKWVERDSKFSGIYVMKNATLHLIFIYVQYHGLLEMLC